MIIFKMVTWYFVWHRIMGTHCDKDTLSKSPMQIQHATCVYYVVRTWKEHSCCFEMQDYFIYLLTPLINLDEGISMKIWCCFFTPRLNNFTGHATESRDTELRLNERPKLSLSCALKKGWTKSSPNHQQVQTHHPLPSLLTWNSSPI